MPAHKPSAEYLALLVALLIQRYAKERGREVTRFRLARKSLRRLAIRQQLRDSLVEDWIDEMAITYGWLVFSSDDEFLLLQADAAQSWTKIATKRCDDLIDRLRQGDASALKNAEDELDPPENDGTEEDTE